MTLTDLSAWLVWLFPLACSLLVPVVARLGDKARNYYAVAIAVITAALAFSMVPGIFSGEGTATNLTAAWIPFGLDAGVFIDSLSVLFAVLVAFFGLIIAVYSLGYMAEEEGLTRYYFLLLLFIGSMIGLVVADNFLQMFIFWEMVGLCSFALISFWYKRPESVKSGMKVFLMTRIGDVFLLGAIGLLYVNLGTFSFAETILNIGNIPIPMLTTIAFLVLGGAVAKSAQLPLHTWLYSAMEAPTSVSALLHSATMVKAGIYLLARFILILGPLAVALPYWLPVTAWIGVLTAILAASLAIHTTDIKGVLAYSTVSQLGFMMAALGTSHGAESIGWFASLFHMVSHAFFEGLGFLLAGGIIHAIGTRDMRLMGGLKKAMPITFILAVLMVLTTSGLPPFAAFFSKGLIITSVTESGNLIQTVLIYLTTAITFAYSLRFLTLTFMGKESKHLQEQHVHEAPKIMLYPAMVLGGLCIVWGLLMPVIQAFMHVELHEVSLLGSFLNLETPIFFALIIPTGLIIYLTYYKNSQTMKNLLAKLNPISTVLKHGYFFDDIYFGIAKGVTRFSEGLGGFEDVISRFPQLVATIVTGFAKIGRKLDRLGDKSLVAFGRAISGFADLGKRLDGLVDRLLELFAAKFYVVSSRLNKAPSEGSLHNYIVAAILGFILIIVLIILTIGVV